MLVIMRKGCTEEDCLRVEEAIRRMGYRPLRVPGADRTAICVTGNKGPVDPTYLARLPGVLECMRVTKPYKLVSREVHPADTVVAVGPARIGGERPVLLAGPPVVETEARTVELARRLRRAGATLFRAGVVRQQGDPYGFRGLGDEALATLDVVRREVGLPVVTEVVDAASVERAAEHADVLQVGARNMENTALLEALAEIDRPVILERGVAATVEEWLLAAEHLLARGEHRVVLCERGIRTFHHPSRQTLDLDVVPLARRTTHLPVLVDPSRGAARRDGVRALARAALAAGAHGLVLPVHLRPETAYVDAQETIDLDTFSGIVRDLDALARLEAIFSTNGEGGA